MKVRFHITPKAQWSWLRLLLGVSDIFDGLVRLLTFGWVTTGTSFDVAIKIAHHDLAKARERTKDD